MSKKLQIKNKDEEDKGKEVNIHIIVEREPDNPYKNLGVIGDSLWKWHQYFEERKRRKKKKSRLTHTPPGVRNDI